MMREEAGTAVCAAVALLRHPQKINIYAIWLEVLGKEEGEAGRSSEA